MGLFFLEVAVCGCSVQRGVYTAGATAIGAGVGYSYHHSTKEAALGGLAGGAAGAIVGEIQDHIGNSKHKAGFEEGYKKAEADVAIKNWEQNTGKNAGVEKLSSKRLIEVKVPRKEQDNVVYDDHYVTLEDYR